MLTVADRYIGRLLLAASLCCVACLNPDRCTPGEQRACTRSLDGGYTQRGYQACGTTGTWSECVSVGACMAPGGAPLPVYGRCGTSEQCGPDTCATCEHYVGVQNPGAFSLCRAYCQNDSDCAPTTSSSGVTPRCILGQCTLLCRAGSTCPRDTRCLAWSDPSQGSTYPGFAGLCE